MEEIEIVVDRQGGVTVEGKGFQGPECEALTAGITEALGEVVETVKKPEYHQSHSRKQTATR